MASIDVDGITTSINQTTGVVTFSVGGSVQAGDYVATITCGDADPVEITITVTAPITTEISILDNRGTPVTSWTVNRLGTAKQLVILRSPSGTTSEISYTLPQADKFTVNLVQDDGTGVGTLEITQDTVCDPRETLNMVITCGSATVTLPIAPK